jgi:hypothetical protein
MYRRMNTQMPLRILSLDGGGVRGISSFYLLKSIMDQMKLKLKHEYEPVEPILYAKARDYVTQIYNMGNYVG